MPVLRIREAVGLREVCKALRGLTREWPVRMEGLEGIKVKDPEAALTCFPAAERLRLNFWEPLAPAEEARMVELLRRHGGTLKRVQAWGGARSAFSRRPCERGRSPTSRCPSTGGSCRVACCRCSRRLT
jgi:hypothetical protein